MRISDWSSDVCSSDLPPLSVDVATLNSAGASYTLTVPTGLKLKPSFSAQIWKSTIRVGAYFSDLDVNDEPPPAIFTDTAPLFTFGSGGGEVGSVVAIRKIGRAHV